MTGLNDPDAEQAMRVVGTLTHAEQRNLIAAAVTSSLAYARTGDVAHVTGHARDLLATLELRAHPEYVEAVRRPAVRTRGPSRLIGEVLAELAG
jgi:hypothetical protein